MEPPFRRKRGRTRSTKLKLRPGPLKRGTRVKANQGTGTGRIYNPRTGCAVTSAPFGWTVTWTSSGAAMPLTRLSEATRCCKCTNAIAEFHVCCVPEAENHARYVRKVKATDWQHYQGEESPLALPRPD